MDGPAGTRRRIWPRQRLPPSSPVAHLPKRSLSVSSRSKRDRIFAGRAYENPVRFDMDVAGPVSPLAFKGWSRSSKGPSGPATRSAISVAKFLQILAALLREFDIAFELASERNRERVKVGQSYFSILPVRSEASVTSSLPRDRRSVCGRQRWGFRFRRCKAVEVADDQRRRKPDDVPPPRSGTGRATPAPS